MTETAAITQNKRYPWLAVTLSLIMPGLGHIYCGRIIKGLILSFLAGLPFLFVMFIMTINKTPFIILIAVVGLFAHILVHLTAIIDSGYTAKHTRGDYKLKDYNRWYVYILLVLMSTGGSIDLAFNIKENYMEAFYIPVASNYPTMIPGDRFLANKLAYKTNDPKRGDMIVFLNPENRRINYIERIVAVEGDTVEIKDGELCINDEKLQRKKLALSTLDNIRIKINGDALEGDVFEESNGDTKYKIFLAQAPHNKTSGDFAKITVPKYNCFVLGDNRNNSRDSRHVGPIPLATIKGRADYLYFPAKDWSRFGKID